MSSVSGKKNMKYTEINKYVKAFLKIFAEKDVLRRNYKIQKKRCSGLVRFSHEKNVSTKYNERPF